MYLHSQQSPSIWIVLFLFPVQGNPSGQAELPVCIPCIGQSVPSWSNLKVVCRTYGYLSDCMDSPPCFIDEAS